jgi:outer membrane receptor protein involved in Fe transport
MSLTLLTAVLSLPALAADGDATPPGAIPEEDFPTSAAPSALTEEDIKRYKGRPTDELVTTARRTKENVLEVPLAITTFSAEEIQQANIRDINDVASFTPGLSFANYFGQELPKPVIRGVAPLDILGGESNAAVYIDGVYVSSENAINLGFLDVERIEVLKGPQGAYFGNNAFSGAINYITLPPTDVFTSKIDLQGGDNGTARAKATLAGPIIGDQLAGRVSILYDDFDGTYENASNLDQDIGGYKYKTIQGSLFWTPVDNFSAQWNLYYSDDEIDPPAQSTTPANCSPSTDDGAFLNYCGDLPTIGKNDLVTIPGETGQTREVTRSILKLDWDVSFGTWSSLTGWSEDKGESFQNGTPGSGSNLFKYTDGIPQGPGFIPGSIVYNTFIFDAGGLLIPGVGDNTNTDLSQEFRFTSNQNQPIRYTAGLYYFNQEKEVLESSRSVEAQNDLPADFDAFCPVCISSFVPGQDLSFPNALFGTFVFGPWFDNFAPFPGFPPVMPAMAVGTTTTETTDYAGFGSIAYDVTDLLTAAAELRYTDREVKISGDNVDPNLPDKSTNDYWTWRFSLDYSITDFSNVYASVARGEKGGGIDSFEIEGTGTGLDGTIIPTEFGNEKNITWEVGYKQAFQEGRIIATGAVYYIDWSDIVLRQFITEYEGLPIQPTAVNQNLGDADIKGFELGLNGQISEHWSGGLGYSYTDAKMTSGSSDRYAEFPQFAPDGDISGQTLPRQPESQFNASLTYRHALVGDWEWYTRGDAFYQSKWYVDLPNQAIVPGRWRANLRLGVETEKYTVELWSTNIFDDDTVDAAFRDVYFTNLTQDTQENAFFPWRMSIANPQRRIIGLRAIARFGY